MRRAPLWFRLSAPLLTAGTCIASGQPNIVLVHVDDLGWQDTSVPMHEETTDFNRRYRTPSMQRLADSGTVLTSNYAAAPVSQSHQPAHGPDPGQNRHHLLGHRDRDTSRTHPGCGPHGKLNGLDEDDVSLPRLLRLAGYRTIHVSKALRAHETPGGDPRRLGFDVNIAGYASGAPGSYLGIHRFKQAHGTEPVDTTSVWDVPGLERWHDQDVYLTEVLADEAVRAMDEAHSRTTVLPPLRSLRHFYPDHGQRPVPRSLRGPPPGSGVRHHDRDRRYGTRLDARPAGDPGHRRRHHRDPLLGQRWALHTPETANPTYAHRFAAARIGLRRRHPRPGDRGPGVTSTASIRRSSPRTGSPPCCRRPARLRWSRTTTWWMAAACDRWRMAIPPRRSRAAGHQPHQWARVAPASIPTPRSATETGN